MRTQGGVVRWAAALALLMAGATSAQGQSVVLSAGASPYDLSGTGTSWVAAARYEADVTRLFAVEVGAAVFRYEPQGGLAHVTYLIPEAGARLRLPVGPVTAEIGAGAGFATAVEGDAKREPTLFAALAVDVPLGAGWALRPEARQRVVEPWVGSTFDVTLGVRRIFRSR